MLHALQAESSRGPLEEVTFARQTVQIPSITGGVAGRQRGRRSGPGNLQRLLHLRECRVGLGDVVERQRLAEVMRLVVVLSEEADRASARALRHSACGGTDAQSRVAGQRPPCPRRPRCLARLLPGQTRATRPLAAQGPGVQEPWWMSGRDSKEEAGCRAERAARRRELAWSETRRWVRTGAGSDSVEATATAGRELAIAVEGCCAGCVRGGDCNSSEGERSSARARFVSLLPPHHGFAQAP